MNDIEKDIRELCSKMKDVAAIGMRIDKKMDELKKTDPAKHKELQKLGEEMTKEVDDYMDELEKK